MTNHEEPTRTANVVVGVDGSADGAQAVRWAEEYAAATGADLTLVTAWHWPTSYGVPITWQGWDPAADAQRVLEKTAAGLTLDPARVHLRVEPGPPGEVLIKVSAGADLLAVGTRGHGRLASAVLGSVSSYCVHHADCTVTVVR
jgi:nucleotide-binding universal stress UspA family protein